jgi:ppGpp synthetase/RelA/SpoT-type nucleotidyltranferase
MTLREQNAVVEKIKALFTSAKVIDRRVAPSHGYRAVHVVAAVDDCPVEIQVRTRLQDLWAQIFEKLADRVGREIRYGSRPLLPPPLSEKLTAVVNGLQRVSSHIATAESLASRAQDLDDVAIVTSDLALIEREMALLLDSVERIRQ